MTLALSPRPDLSQRTGLSKSALVAFDLCQTRAWFDIHARRPLIPTERLVFGRALDRGVEQLVIQKAAGYEPDYERAIAAVDEVLAEQEPVDAPVDREEVLIALRAFVTDILPTADWTYAVTQVWLHPPVPEWGEVEGHPDILLGSGEGSWDDVRDVKSAQRAKNEADVRNSTELGIYALLVEAEKGEPPARVGYLTWVRTKKPWWQALVVPVTPRMLDRTHAYIEAYLRATRADTRLNEDGALVNWSMNGGPKFAKLCSDCTYAPKWGGTCQIAEEDPNGG